MISILLPLLPLDSEARVYILLNEPSPKPFPIAIADLPTDGPKKIKGWSEGLSEQIRNDLILTGLFDVVDRSDYPKGSLEPDKIQFPSWTLIGVQAVAGGTYSVLEDGIRISLYLYDPFLGQQLINRNYRAKEGEVGTVAHHFADEIMKELTGERGVSSTKIAYVCQPSKRKKGVKEICLMDMDGKNQRQLTNHRSISLSPDWSGAGNEIVYTSYIDGIPELFTVNASGATYQVTQNNNINLSPRWTGQGYLTVASALDGDTELYLFSSKGKVLRQLTNSFGIDINPSWSPDGKRFVFASERAGRLHIFSANNDGGEIRRLTYVGYHNDNPVWSPRGDKIAFQARDAGAWDLFIMNSDGSMIQRLTANQGDNESPSWAPNGRMIVFGSTRNDALQLFIMKEDGSNQTPVGPKGGATQPSWSPWFD
ncbi:MAG: Tol-Pal system beta propeller repeat protein TolB [Deltaproteobacteria bacterium]|nr:Tol-Pal system beta propeller repeat protein TolB [Deltaproteobacteria bacterium]MBI4196607.1 Tol-Pal system beta propeller repeat protein TolB [Deltaproteobacteria bacterium]